MENPRIIPDEAVRMMKEGNRRFMDNELRHPHCDRGRRSTTSIEGQHPFAAVLACADSRVPVEVICDRGVGDLFVVRVAGNVLGMNELGSIEYAVEHLGAPVFVVMGHNKCGAVKAVVDEGLLEGNLRGISEKIIPAVEEVRRSQPGQAPGALVDEVARVNVWNTIADAFRSSETIRKKVKLGELELLGAFYDIDSGELEWMGTHPDQASLVT